MGLGSNQGSKTRFLLAASALLRAKEVGTITQTSEIYDTEPLGPSNQNHANAAIRIHTERSPEELMHSLFEIECELFRERGQRWSARTLDADLLWFEGAHIEREELTVPHRELQNRTFALAPLLDVAPELESELGPVLAAHGGRPPKKLPVHVEVCGRELVARGGERLDVLATGMLALAQRFFPLKRAPSDSAIECRREDQAAPPVVVPLRSTTQAGLVDALIETLHSGLRVEELALQTSSLGVVIGRAGAPIGGRKLGERVVLHERPTPDGFAACFRGIPEI
ncbi:MAG: 2-amino-4-hydroxy-6-hydroxymethyldihydropteridine diphosphokinase [Myxococcota bacterium]